MRQHATIEPVPSWELFEREVARVLDGYRISRSEERFESAADVLVPDMNLVVDAKLRRGFTHHDFVATIRNKYCTAGQVPVLATRTPGDRDAFVALPLENFRDLLRIIRTARATIAAMKNQREPGPAFPLRCDSNDRNQSTKPKGQRP
jgi:hypothetical protein